MPVPVEPPDEFNIDILNVDFSRVSIPVSSPIDCASVVVDRIGPRNPAQEADACPLSLRACLCELGRLCAGARQSSSSESRRMPIDYSPAFDVVSVVPGQSSYLRWCVRWRSSDFTSASMVVKPMVAESRFVGTFVR